MRSSTVRTRPPRLRFTQLTLQNWRNFRAVEMTLGARAFILGPNASGKSNLLDALRFVSELAQPGSGGMQAAIERRGGLSSLRSLFARNPSDVLLRVDVGTDTAPSIWQYELEFNLRRSEKVATVAREFVRHNGTLVGRRERNDSADPRDWRQTLLEQDAASRKFRDLQEFLASSRYLHVVPQIVRDPSRARLDGEDPFGGDLLRRMKNMPEKSRLPRLERIGKALQIAVPQFVSFELINDPQGVPHLQASYQHWRGKAARQSEVRFSDGTLRLIGLLWSMSEQGGPLLLEEPELSLNDAVIRELPRMLERMQRLSGRQAIVTTHSGALLDESGVGLREVYIIEVGSDGSRIECAADKPTLTAKVDEGWTVDQAVLPLLRPEGVETLASIDVAA